MRSGPQRIAGTGEGAKVPGSVKKEMPSPEQLDTVGRSTGMYSVALFGLFDSQGQQRLELAGTGTLVAIGDCYYVLTAAHVWHECLKKSDGIGLTLKEGVDHRFFMRIDTLSVVELPRPEQWNEWGPDAALIRVPREYAAKIEVYRVFYRLDKQRKSPAECKYRVRIVVGTPAVFADRTPQHAELPVNAMFVEMAPEFQTRGDYDYIDFDMDPNHPGVPKDFRGVSGGGLWHVGIDLEGEAGRVKTVQVLAGVAFHQQPLESGHTIVRCHGPETIQRLICAAKARLP